MRIIAVIIASFVLAACTPNQRIMQDSENRTVQPVATGTPAPQLSDLERDLRAMQDAQFTFVYILRRKDGAPFDADDRRYAGSAIPPEMNRRVVSDQGRAIVIAKERLSRLDSVWRLDTRNGQMTKVADCGVWINLRTVIDSAGELLVYTGQTPDSPTNLHKVTLREGAAPEMITRYQAELAERIHPETRVLAWRSSAGVPAYGVLYLPPGASAQNWPFSAPVTTSPAPPRSAKPCAMSSAIASTAWTSIHSPWNFAKSRSGSKPTFPAGR